MLPFVLIALIAVPLVIAGYVAMKRSRGAYEQPAEADAADETRMERDFAASEEYQERWRAEQNSHRHEDHL